jgi:hypothetical protein
LKGGNPNAPHFHHPMYPFILCADGNLTNSSPCKGDSGGI